MTAPLFPLLHDGGSPATERIEHGTAVTLAHDGTEQRQPTRALPRVSLSATYSAPSDTASGAVVLALMRTGGLVHVPLGCHSASINEPTRLDQGINADDPQALAGNYSGSLATSLAVPVVGAWPTGAAWVAPSADAWLQPAREIEHRGGDSRIWRAQLSFELTPDYREELPALVGPLVFPAHYGLGVKPVEVRTAQQDRLDYGRRWLLEQRYIKRSARITVALRGREAIKAFRAFLYACRGRLNAFSYRLQGDAVASTWRLGTDAVQLEYRSRVHAVVQLELVEVSE